MARKVMVATAAAAVLFIAVTAASADHAWNGYHWRSDNLAPTVVDKTSSTAFDVPAAVAEWRNLGIPIVPQMTAGSADVEVVVKRMNANWLGVARISVDSSTGHIQAGRVELNQLYLNSLTFAQWDHVVCQELGHIWGLDHNFDGATGGTPDNTCMNSSLHLGEYTSPNSHDAEQLNAIYNHIDTTGGGGDGGGGGGGCPPGNPDHPKCNPASGSWITVHTFRAR